MGTSRTEIMDFIKQKTDFDSSFVRDCIARVLQSVVTDAVAESFKRNALLATRHTFTYEYQYYVTDVEDALKEKLSGIPLSEMPFEQLLDYILFSDAVFNADQTKGMLKAVYQFLLDKAVTCTAMQYLTVVQLQRTSPILRIMGTDGKGNLIVTESFMPTAPLWFMSFEAYGNHLILKEIEQPNTLIGTDYLYIEDDTEYTVNVAELPVIKGEFPEYKEHFGDIALLKQVYKDRNIAVQCYCTVFKTVLSELHNKLQDYAEQHTKTNFVENMHEVYGLLVKYWQVCVMLEYKLPTVDNFIYPVKEKNVGTVLRNNRHRRFCSGFVRELCSFSNLRDALYSELMWDSLAEKDWTYIGTQLKIEDLTDWVAAVLEDMQDIADTVEQYLDMPAETRLGMFEEKLSERPETDSIDYYRHNLDILYHRELRAKYLSEIYPEVFEWC